MPDFDYSKLSEDFSIHLYSGVITVSRIKDVDLLFDHLLQKNPETKDVQDERMPYWSNIWPSAIALSQFIDENKNLISGKKVLEVGCGLGLPGIVAGLNGADVLMTDYLPEALAFAKINWQRNLSLAFNGKTLDWRNTDGIEPVDVILASDVAYESRSFTPLRTALKKMLKPDGVLLLSEPNRKFASPFIEFLREDFILESSDRIISLDKIEYTVSIHVGKFSAFTR